MAFEQIGLYGDAMDLWRLLLGLAANQRHEMELHVRPSVAVEIEETAALDDVGGEEAGAEEEPFEEIAQACGPFLMTAQADRRFEPRPDRRGDVVLEIAA